MTSPASPSTETTWKPLPKRPKRQSTAQERARAPTLIECKTYRIYGHWTGDPTPYRTREEVEEWKKKDPIKRLRKVLERTA